MEGEKETEGLKAMKRDKSKRWNGLADCGESLGELVRAGGRLAAAEDAVEAFDDVFALHAFDERRDAKMVAWAAACEDDGFDCVIVI